MKIFSHFCLLQVVLGVIIVTLGICQCEGKTFEQDVTLNQSEKDIFDKFKKRVFPLLDKDYMKEDIYVLRWLREKHFNIDEAQQALIQNLKWRRAEKMDSINKEDWTEMEEEYPYFVSGYDNEGKPTAVANFDHWDLRQGVLQGKRNKIIRWMTKGIQDAVDHVRELQHEGKNVTRWNFIINMKNFNLIQHGCIQCLPVYVGFVTNWEKYYPDSVDKLILINAPAIFEVVLGLIRPLMSEDSREALQVFGTNKNDWQPYLDSFIRRNQLPVEYGGSQVEKPTRENRNL